MDAGIAGLIDAALSDLGGLPLPDMRALQARLNWLSVARPAQLPPDDPWNIWLAMAGRGFGKLLDLKTPVPTPSGWTTMGALRAGDEVFDEAGKVCRVAIAHPITVNAEAYRITFSDRSYIDACADHQWVTWTHAERKAFLRSPYEDPTRFPDNWPAWRLKRMLGRVTPSRQPVIHVDAPRPQIRTTRDILETLRHGKRGDLNHCIPQTAPLDLPDVALPIDPYVLGAWLGDGDSGSGNLTSADPEVIEEIRLAGERIVRLGGISYGIGGRDHARDQATGRMVSNGSLHSRLRAAGLLDNKHVPAIYLRASARQRQALLQGLMDTDGGVEGASTVAFTNCNKGLADSVYELVVSLGMRATRDDRIPICTNNGNPGQRAYRVTFTPTIDVFRLPRKRDRIRFDVGQRLRRCHRMIVSVEPIPSVPMRCITVDSPNSMYLAGEAMIPTHNSRLGAEWSAHESWTQPNTITHVIAPTFGDLIRVCFDGPAGLLSVIPYECRVGDWNKSEAKIELTNGTIIQGYSATEPDRLRGPQCHRFWGDEVAAWVRAQLVWDMAMFGRRLGNRIRAVATTTPKPIPLIHNLVKRAKAGRDVIVTGGSTYENRANLGREFFDELTKYEGTKLGEQEIHAVLFDPEESGIVRRSQWRLWPADREIPLMNFIITSLDTAFTEATINNETGDPDFSACGVWGVFEYERRMHAMLLDAWAERLGLPDLLAKVKKERKFRYGGSQKALLKPVYGPAITAQSGREPDLILVEEKGSGISLLQFLARENLPGRPYNPGNASKLTRLHIASTLFAQGLIWAPESKKRRGEPISWAEPVISQVCTFHGDGTIPHDDHVDQSTQALNTLMVLDWVKPRPVPPKVLSEDKLSEDAIRKADRRNPYGS